VPIGSFHRLTLVLAAFLAATVIAAPVEASTCRALEMQLMQAQGAGAASPRVQSIQNLLAVRGCGGYRMAPQVQPVRLAVRNASPSKRRARRSTGSEGGTAAARGTYRTLCVRTCDGYYFPISYSTTRKHFGADETMCQQLCPAGEADLYYHALGTEGPEDMLSLEGAPYTALPDAFRYRAALDGSCTCGRPAEAGALFATATGSDPIGHAARPRPRPAMGEDPETLANRAGSFVPSAVAPQIALSEPEPARAVRFVGPYEIQPVLLSELPE
jgi:Protein of unknown function (DUF2865)